MYLILTNMRALLLTDVERFSSSFTTHFNSLPEIKLHFYLMGKRCELSNRNHTKYKQEKVNNYKEYTNLIFINYIIVEVLHLHITIGKDFSLDCALDAPFTSTKRDSYNGK